MSGQDDIDRSIAAIEIELADLNAKRAALLTKLRALRREKISLTQTGGQLALTLRAPVVTNHSSEAEKLALFSTLFKGREDVYPKRFQTGEPIHQSGAKDEGQPAAMAMNEAVAAIFIGGSDDGVPGADAAFGIDREK